MKQKWIALSLVCILLFSACSSTPKPEPEAKEITKASAKSVDTPEAQLLSDAQRHYSQQLYSIAQGKFETLRDSYPTGPYREYAEIKIADGMFQSSDYLAAGQAYEDFTKNYPTSPSTPYALMKAGRSYHLAQRGVGRDSSPLLKAVEFYQKVLAEYPDSLYASTASTYEREAQRGLAEHEQFISDFYSRGDKEAAAKARDLRYQKQLKGIPKEKIQVVSAKQAGLEVPQVRSLQADAHAVEAPGMIAARPVDSKKASPTEEEEVIRTTYFIQGAGCKSGNQKQVFLLLNQQIPLEDLPSRESISSVRGIASVQLSQTSAKGLTLDCFGKNDLVISREGLITLRGAQRIEMLSLDSPPRLLLVVR